MLAGHDPLWPSFFPWLTVRLCFRVDRTFDPRPRSRYSCPYSCPTSRYPWLSTSKIEQARLRDETSFSTFSHYRSRDRRRCFRYCGVVAAALSRTTFATLLQFAIELLLLRALQWLVGNAITSPPLQISFWTPSLDWRKARYSAIVYLKSERERGREKGYSFSLESVDIDSILD